MWIKLLFGIVFIGAITGCIIEKSSTRKAQMNNRTLDLLTSKPIQDGFHRFGVSYGTDEKFFFGEADLSDFYHVEFVNKEIENKLKEQFLNFYTEEHPLVTCDCKGKFHNDRFGIGYFEVSEVGQCFP